jgi:small subunit ribosomal protein S13
MGVTKPKDEHTKKGKEEEKKVAKPVKIERTKEIRTIVRIANTDLDGEKPVFQALRNIKGVSYAMSKAICKVVNLNPNQKLGTLDAETIEKLEEVIKEPINFGVPSFLVNRRRDIETGKDMHLIGPDLDMVKKFDIQRYVDLRTYRGWRHMFGQPVRGQETRSSFRQKGKAVGVMKKEIKLQMKKAEEGKEEKKK